jgi:alpha-glucosidase
MKIPATILRVASSIAVWSVVLTSAQATGKRGHEISSPVGRIEVRVQFEKGLTYSVNYAGTPLVAPLRLGLTFADVLQLGHSVQLLNSETQRNNTQWRDDFGKFSVVKDHYRELRLCFRELRAAPAKPVDFEVLVRAYNDGVAWRYVLPKQDALDQLQLTADETQFRFPADYRAWVGQNTTYGNQFPEIRLSQLNADRRSLTLVVETPKAFVAVAEADARDWAGCSLVAAGVSNAFGARAALISPVVSQTPQQSSWHALIIGKTAGDLAVSTMLKNLATPSRIGDTSWIKPGITAWHAWWTGVNPYWDQHRGLHARGNTRSHKDYIDLAAQMGWPYMLVDWFWYDQEGADPETAIKPQAHIDMLELMAYAKSEGVKLLLWVNSKNIPSLGADKLLSTYKAWGAAGVKIDLFQNNGSQPTQRWLEQLLESAAKHKLVEDFHGIYTPTGLSRTWPNLLTQEGVLGVEYVKLGKEFTPPHMMTLPFTRGLLGPADITPGAFLNVREEEFVPNSIPATVTGTRARQLALSVLMDSPFLCLCDSPRNYLGQPGLEFYRDLPTTWDETRVLSSDVMEHLVQARRKGDRWYIAAMNGEPPLSIPVKLDFLRPGRFTLRSFADTPESATRPAAIGESSRTVTRKDTLEIRMERAGGFVAVVWRP